MYVAAIDTHHDAVDGKSVGKHDLVIRLFRSGHQVGSSHLVPSCYLSLVQMTLKVEPFEPLESVELKFLLLKTVLLTALASVKRVGDMQAFLVDDSCDDSVTLTLS